jgi:hypothetical protein
MRFCRRQLVKLGTITENMKFHSAFSPQMLITIWQHSVAKTTLSVVALSAAALSCVMRIRWKQGRIENLEYRGEFEKDFRKFWLYFAWHLLMIEWCKKRIKNRLWKSCTYVGVNDKDKIQTEKNDKILKEKATCYHHSMSPKTCPGESQLANSKRLRCVCLVF